MIDSLQQVLGGAPVWPLAVVGVVGAISLCVRVAKWRAFGSR